MSHRAHIAEEKGTVYDLRYDGRFFILRIDGYKSELFKRALAEGRTVSLQEYGFVMFTGWGEPDATLAEYLQSKYRLYQQ